MSSIFVLFVDEVRARLIISFHIQIYNNSNWEFIDSQLTHTHDMGQGATVEIGWIDYFVFLCKNSNFHILMWLPLALHLIRSPAVHFCAIIHACALWRRIPNALCEWGRVVIILFYFIDINAHSVIRQRIYTKRHDELLCFMCLDVQIEMCLLYQCHFGVHNSYKSAQAQRIPDGRPSERRRETERDRIFFSFFSLDIFSVLLSPILSSVALAHFRMIL